MARHSRRTRHRSRHHRMRGGQSGSATEWGMRVNGTADAQYNRVFGSEYANVPGNVIIGAQGQNISQVPSTADLSRIQSAGRRRRRGGFLGEVVNQAIVPLGLLAMQQTYKRKRSGGRRRTRRHRLR